MLRSSRTSLLLVFSLLCGLWTAAAHGPDHHVALAHVDDCVVCVFSQGLGNGAVSAAASLVLAQSAPSATSLLSRPVIYAAPRARVRVRGPPLNLA